MTATPRPTFDRIADVASRLREQCRPPHPAERGDEALAIELTRAEIEVILEALSAVVSLREEVAELLEALDRSSEREQANEARIRELEARLSRWMEASAGTADELALERKAHQLTIAAASAETERLRAHAAACEQTAACNQRQNVELVTERAQLRAECDELARVLAVADPAAAGWAVLIEAAFMTGGLARLSNVAIRTLERVDLPTLERMAALVLGQTGGET